MKLSAYSLLLVALMVVIACTQSAPAQTFKRVKVKGGAALAQIAAGGASVWARASNGNPYILKGKLFVLANSISLSQIAVGGGNALQADAVWGLDSSGNIYKATKSGTSWVFSPIPGVLDFIAVGIGYNDSCHPYEVWGLNPAAQIFRYNFCVQNWDQVPGSLATLAVGNSDIWGINGNGAVFRFRFSKLLFYQVVTAPTLTQITVGPNGVWGIDGNGTGQLYQYDNDLSFFGYPGLWAQVQVGGDGVWLSSATDSGQIFRFDPSTRFLVLIPNQFVSISAGSGGGVWGINSSGQAYGFSTP